MVATVYPSGEGRLAFWQSVRRHSTCAKDSVCTCYEVITGLSIRVGSRELRHVETTAVYFAALDEEDIAWYVQSGEGRDKAGAYAIQGLASRFIPRIEGSYANVVGLPIAAVCALIRKPSTDA